MVRANTAKIGSLLSLRKENTTCFEKKVGTINTPKLHKKKIKPSPLKVDLFCISKFLIFPFQSESGRGVSGPGLGLTLTSVTSSSSKLKAGGAGPVSSVVTSSGSSQGGGTELSSSAKKRLKILKQQATDMTSISKKKSK